jgi:hypothetical protein
MRRILVLLAGSFLVLGGTRVQSLQYEEYEKGTLSIYFMEEKVGYEEFTWRRDDTGTELTVEGRITKPVEMAIEEMVIRTDPDFIPTAFRFLGSVGGVEQDIESAIDEGEVRTTIRVGGQEQISTGQIRRDAVLLPNPVFSPYMVISKKFRCTLKERRELSAYIIPQVETTIVLHPKEESPCILVMEMGAAQIELVTDESGQLNGLSIPVQQLRVMRD